MIQVATIVPSKLLHLTEDEMYHMSLAQLIGVDEHYTDFYRRQKALGKFVLMDNGAAEGEQPTAEELIPKIKLLQPTEVILPDTIFNCEDTLRKAKVALAVFKAEFADEEGKMPFRIMAVPQGEDFVSWMECARNLLAMEEIDSLGISKFMTSKMGPEARYLGVQAIRSMEEEFDNKKHDIHLLGCWATATEIGEIQQDFDIRGCDSAIAYVYARAGLHYDPMSPRPEGEIDFINGTVKDEDLMKSNKLKWEQYCCGILTAPSMFNTIIESDDDGVEDDKCYECGKESCECKEFEDEEE